MVVPLVDVSGHDPRDAVDGDAVDLQVHVRAVDLQLGRRTQHHEIHLRVGHALHGGDVDVHTVVSSIRVLLPGIGGRLTIRND